MRLVAPTTLVLAFTTGGLVSAEAPLRESHPRDDFVVREEMVPMRDGVRLFTLIIVPKQSGEGLPILLERTPYDASRAVGGRATTIDK